MSTQLERIRSLNHELRQHLLGGAAYPRSCTHSYQHHAAIPIRDTVVKSGPNLAP
jgi:hypothetical protein